MTVNELEKIVEIHMDASEFEDIVKNNYRLLAVSTSKEVEVGAIVKVEPFSFNRNKEEPLPFFYARVLNMRVIEFNKIIYFKPVDITWEVVEKPEDYSFEDLKKENEEK